LSDEAKPPVDQPLQSLPVEVTKGLMNLTACPPRRYGDCSGLGPVVVTDVRWTMGRREAGRGVL
jgi:hypothetical protein